MSVHPHEGDLHRHYDGELTARESWEIEAHLRECATCAAAYDEVRQVVEQVAELPEAIEPPVDLWPAIAARLGSGSDELEARRRGREKRIRTTILVSWLGAVAAALVVGVGLGRVFPGGTPMLATGPGVGTEETASAAPTAATPSAAAPSAAAPAAVLASYEEPAYDEAVAELETILEAMRDTLEPETVEVVEQNLAIIDQAIAEARAALLADPANQQLYSHLSNTMQQKLRLLRVVTGAMVNT